MIIKNGKEIVEYYYGNIQIIEMYRGKHLIYEVIRAMKEPESYLKMGVFDIKPIFDKDESYEALSIEADLEYCI